tara:strand:- start:626 stop:973 length:348 start_codon:yes stop_codon:yes gene_type:complete
MIPYLYLVNNSKFWESYSDEKAVQSAYSLEGGSHIADDSCGRVEPASEVVRAAKRWLQRPVWPLENRRSHHFRICECWPPNIFGDRLFVSVNPALWHAFLSQCVVGASESGAPTN